MKETPTSDPPVRVRPRKWEEEPPLNVLYEGVYEVTLNYTTTISFVPVVTLPYDHTLLPENLDELTSPEQARLEAVLYADWAVTPDDARAGTKAQLPPLSYGDGGVVFYVTGEQFERYAADLEGFFPELFNLHSDTPISALRGHPAIDFIAGLDLSG
jgi:hypothetical protein